MFHRPGHRSEPASGQSPGRSCRSRSAHHRHGLRVAGAFVEHPVPEGAADLAGNLSRSSLTLMVRRVLALETGGV